jgi:aminoglycoside phosphotransferase (APT) family kinase protein
MRTISEAVVDNLALLHQIDIHTTGLDDLGKANGYVDRQVSGWIRRYKNAQTDEISNMDALASWMIKNQPKDGCAGLIHNDYKYDNLVLDIDQPARILAVLDWEMATTGDTRMDLGTSLAYWTEGKEAKMINMSIGNLSWLPGNLTRQEVVERYAKTTGHNLDNILFYFVFGTFKIGVIAQQIYARWKNGSTKDPRFEQLIHVIHYLAKVGSTAIDRDRISDL